LLDVSNPHPFNEVKIQGHTARSIIKERKLNGIEAYRVLMALDDEAHHEEAKEK
jgi:hypothetical protein